MGERVGSRNTPHLARVVQAPEASKAPTVRTRVSLIVSMSTLVRQTLRVPTTKLPEHISAAPVQQG
jgi:hypothetical protein